ncbi:hypothetical protein DERP_013797 [Dermatophagoides pteronyssinus]|uniref:Uncharacterized protein n=1 Tax=Dermatophagoides pteronyssinus TaxID=6956 RepID=A0ABQ8JCM3_DERPT|nr:hypothetical protein DERP_013797 [Dermatophagoides pteronyssinus]
MQPIDYYEFLDEILQQLYQYKHDHYDYVKIDKYPLLMFYIHQIYPIMIFYLMSFKFSYIF